MASSPEKTVSVLSLFTIEKPAWTVEAACVELNVSVSTAYRYFATLSEFGLLTTESPGVYVLGPAFIQYDRQIQLTDPLLLVARPAMDRLIALAPSRTTLVLCRVFHDTVLCVHQVQGKGPQSTISYERGRPMPLFYGATSKIILANLDSRRLRRIYDAYSAEILTANLGANWKTFRSELSKIRKEGYLMTHGEVDEGRWGISVPIFDSDRRVLGSLSFVIARKKIGKDKIKRLAGHLTKCALKIEQALAIEIGGETRG